MDAALHEILGVARQHLEFADVCAFVGPSDPGWIEYLGQMEALRTDTADESASLDHEPVMLALTEAAAEPSVPLLWYRVHAAATALGSDDPTLWMAAPVALGRLLADVLWLEASGAPDSPVADLAPVCRALAEDPAADPDAVLFARLGELVAAAHRGADATELDALAEQVVQLEEELCTEGAYSSPEYLWGTTLFTDAHGAWVALVRTHLAASEVRSVATLRDTLLEHGSRWPPEDWPPATGARTPLPSFDAGAIGFFAAQARSESGRRAAIRLAERHFAEGVPQSPSPVDLTALNNAICVAHAAGHHEVAGRWASWARPHARANRYLPHNLACAFAAVGKLSDAVDMCVLAVEAGVPTTTLRDDADLAPLRTLDRFRMLVGRSRRRR